MKVDRRYGHGHHPGPRLPRPAPLYILHLGASSLSSWFS
ncbi:hypothetical protein SNOG_12366 [Parastagonospora nodorum SN15]|uniref:Uncharacterized protein n=1 Tax=Phaeosphaeria nodorum (strain SN15 / ATCC MYA-4574 / FGSC 10173) TaxID=321614 RepID=Q0U798_PHANO|nr:hypothetical protein SNOG_12366 [Parastagonospora nodorum SN15]EAT80179.1 hypothetical protein SNOG_12366 [Parastagonospora nodorum SN15]